MFLHPPIQSLFRPTLCNFNYPSFFKPDRNSYKTFKLKNCPLSQRSFVQDLQGIDALGFTTNLSASESHNHRRDSKITLGKYDDIMNHYADIYGYALFLVPCIILSIISLGIFHLIKDLATNLPGLIGPIQPETAVLWTVAILMIAITIITVYIVQYYEKTNKNLLNNITTNPELSYEKADKIYGFSKGSPACPTLTTINEEAISANPIEKLESAPLLSPKPEANFASASKEAKAKFCLMLFELTQEVSDKINESRDTLNFSIKPSI